MRFLTFSYLKHVNLKSFGYRLLRQASGSASSGAIPAAEVDRGKTSEPLPKADPSLIEFSPSWPETEAPECRAAVARDMQVFPDFVTEEEELALMEELEPVLRRMRYEFDHWDDAIHGYRETERAREAWSRHNGAVLARVQALAFGAHDVPLAHVHVLDLAAAGHIKPHVDAVRFCGDVIAGICLCSPAVMRLRHEAHEARELDALLLQRALYVMKGTARYEFSHEVLGGERSKWRGELLPRKRRVALITRSEPKPAQH